MDPKVLFRATVAPVSCQISCQINARLCQIQEYSWREWLRNFPVQVLCSGIGYRAGTLFESFTCHHVPDEGP